MDSEKFHKILNDELQKFDFIIFAILFGSQAENKSTSISDIDIGIYSKIDLKLHDIGLISVCLEKATTKKTDVIVLNDLYKKNPFLSFQIVSKGNLIFCKDVNVLVSFKSKTFLYYLDVKPLYDQINRSLLNRLKNDRFGDRDYA